MSLFTAFRDMNRMRRKEALYAYLFISPWLIGFLLWTLGPMLFSLFLSFTEYNITRPPQWIGLHNYVRAFARDELFWQSIKVTFTYAIFAIPLNLVFGFTLALLLNQDIPGVSIWRTVYYIPSVVSGVAVSMLWMLVFQPQYGVLNYLLSMVGIKGPPWLFSPKWVLPAFVVMSLWGVGGGMVIYLAGLQGIPTALYEAAEIDGAGWWRQLFHITLPMMSPTIFFNLVMGLIGTFQIFTSAYVMTAGGPMNASLFYNLYLYTHAFSNLKMGYASMLAWILFAIILSLTLVTIRSSAAWVYYEGELRRG
jgi:multiple sugar transport system permease protein